MDSDRLTSSDMAPATSSAVPDPDADGRLLDAYSGAVVGVVDAVSRAVVSVQTHGRGGGSGTGVLVTPDGYLLTNAHVVDATTKPRVMLADGRNLAAQTVGRDPGTDLALLRVLGTGLPYATLGASHRVRVGQLAVAIGNPLGFSATVSAGIVSAKGRALRAQNGQLIEEVLQHTAPLNPGNSGGPLVTTDHAVVGINTAIIATAQGIGFAIPSDTADWVISEILGHGEVRRARLGIRAHTRILGGREARRYVLQQPSVVEVVGIEPDSAAARGGLRVHDLILAIDGLPVIGTEDLLRRLSHRAALDPALLTVGRNGARHQVELVPDRRPAPPAH